MVDGLILNSVGGSGDDMVSSCCIGNVHRVAIWMTWVNVGRRPINNRCARRNQRPDDVRQMSTYTHGEYVAKVCRTVSKRGVMQRKLS